VRRDALVRGPVLGVGTGVSGDVYAHPREVRGEAVGFLDGSGGPGAGEDVVQGAFAACLAVRVPRGEWKRERESRG
jgi:hypothetical protein